MIIGVVNVISLKDMSVITYALETYELAKLQAKELLMGVNFESRLEMKDKNGLRQQIHTCVEHIELLVVKEMEVGTKVLEVRNDNQS